MLTRLEIYGVIGLLIAGLIVGNYIYVKHLQTKVAGLETEVANVKSQTEVIRKAQEATDKTVKAIQVRRTQNVKDTAKIDQVVESGDNPAMDNLWLDRGMLAPKANSAKGGTTGNPKHISP